MPDIRSLDIAILDSGSNGSLVVYARSGSDTALAHVECAKELNELSALRDKIEKAICGKAEPLKEAEVESYGQRLFQVVILEDIKKLYDKVPEDTPTRIHICSNHSIIQKLPWELIRGPGASPPPDRNRIVVRIVPTIGLSAPQPLQRAERIKVVFAVAEPIDQNALDWNETLVYLQQKFSKRLNGRPVDLEFLRVTTREELAAVMRERVDVVHFCCHGEIREGKSGLVFVDEQNHESDFVPADQLAIEFKGKTARLIILSACNSGAGSFETNFTVIAKGLVLAGVPAVVASQFSLPVDTIAPFSVALYDSLFTSGDIDRAVAEARAYLAFVMKDYAKIDWAIPVLYRHVSSAAVMA
jgi:hypothetical protein